MGKILLPGQVAIRGFTKGDILFTQSQKASAADPYAEVIKVFLWKSEDNVEAMKQVLRDNKIRREQHLTPSGISGGGGGISLPVTLMRALEKHDPELFSNTPIGKRKRDMFRSHYPAFCV